MRTITKESAMIQHMNIRKSLTTQLKRFIVNRFWQKNIANNLKTTKHLKYTKKDIPGRPVVSSIDCHTSKLSKFVDHYLQPKQKLYHPTLKALQVS